MRTMSRDNSNDEVYDEELFGECIKCEFPFNALYPPACLVNGRRFFIKSNQLRNYWFQWLKDGWLCNRYYCELEIGDFVPWRKDLKNYHWYQLNGRLIEYYAINVKKQLNRISSNDSNVSTEHVAFLKEELKGYKKQIARRKYKTKRAWIRGRKPKKNKKNMILKY